MRAAIFDLGDTLLRWTVGAPELQRASADLGAALSSAQARRLWSELHQRPATAEELCMGAGWSRTAYAQALQAYYGSADAAAPGLATWLVSRAVDSGSYEAFPGAADLVSDLVSAGIRLSVVSDTGFDIRPALIANQLDPLCDNVLLSHEQGACKPAPWLFLKACDLMEVTPNETLMIGDNVVADGGSAAAGVAALILPHVKSAGVVDYGVVRAALGVTP